MISPLRTLARAAAAAVALVAVASTTNATAVDADSPTYQAPSVGQCRTYGYSTYSAKWDASPAASCTKPHTAKTLAVVQLPFTMTWPKTDAEDEAFYTQLSNSGAMKGCATAFRKELGANYKTLAKTAYTWSFYSPTPDQQAHGARWIRCDINLAGGTKLQKFRGARTKLGRVTRNEQACRTGGKTPYLTGCTLRHAYGSAVVVRAPFKSYGNRDQWMRLAGNKCTAAVGHGWWANWPGATAWADGNHFLTCYKHTKK